MIIGQTYLVHTGHLFARDTVCRTILSRGCRLPVCTMHENNRTKISQGCRLPICARYSGRYYLAGAGCPCARESSDNIISRMQSACIHETYLTIPSRACEQPVCARIIGQHFLADAGCLYAREVFDCVFFAHVRCAYARHRSLPQSTFSDSTVSSATHYLRPYLINDVLYYRHRS